MCVRSPLLTPFVCALDSLTLSERFAPHPLAQHLQRSYATCVVPVPLSGCPLQPLLSPPRHARFLKLCSSSPPLSLSIRRFPLPRCGCVVQDRLCRWVCALPASPSAAPLPTTPLNCTRLLSPLSLSLTLSSLNAELARLPTPLSTPLRHTHTHTLAWMHTQQRLGSLLPHVGPIALRISILCSPLLSSIFFSVPLLRPLLDPPHLCASARVDTDRSLFTQTRPAHAHAPALLLSQPRPPPPPSLRRRSNTSPPRHCKPSVALTRCCAVAPCTFLNSAAPHLLLVFLESCAVADPVRRTACACACLVV